MVNPTDDMLRGRQVQQGLCRREKENMKIEGKLSVKLQGEGATVWREGRNPRAAAAAATLNVQTQATTGAC
jgi:hypothetical protein